MQYEPLWSEVTLSSQLTDAELRMFFGECSGPH